MSEAEFGRFAGLIRQCLGIKMPPIKRTMLESRLRRRLRTRGLQDYGEYWDYLQSPGGMEDELVHMMDVVTTNKTDFFREPTHFEFLLQRVLPGARPDFRLWSAGCSSGEEAWSLAMVLAEHRSLVPGFHFDILATDISTQVLEKAARAVYTEERVEPVPPPLVRRYLMRSRDRSRGMVRVVPELRDRVSFQRLNLMDSDYPTGRSFDVVFCRNVLIYFERRDQEAIVEKILRRVSPGGHLFLGHSETLQGMSLPVTPVGPMVYRKARR